MQKRQQLWRTFGLAFLAIVLYLFAVPTVRAQGGMTQQTALNALPGRYYQGSLDTGQLTGSGYSLTLSKDRTFVYRAEACSPALETVTGTYSIKNNLLILSPNSKSLRDRLYEWKTNRYLIVHWGKRCYLVSADGLIDFCNYINSINGGEEPAYLEAFRRQGDRTLPVTGLPDVPTGFQKYLLSRPLAARITTLLSESDGWINKGAHHGLVAGMTLNFPGQFSSIHPIYGDIILTEVEVDRAKFKRNTSTILAVGQILTSPSNPDYALIETPFVFAVMNGDVKKVGEMLQKAAPIERRNLLKQRDSTDSYSLIQLAEKVTEYRREKRHHYSGRLQILLSEKAEAQRYENDMADSQAMIALLKSYGVE